MTVLRRRFELRDRTVDVHAALDATIGSLDDLDAYRRYLLGLHAFRIPVERALEGFPGKPLQLAKLIEADLADVGLSASTAAGFPKPEDASRRAGIDYVLAGSALGARLLRRQAQALGLEPRHLAAQTRDPGEWQAFCARLEALEPFDPDAAADGALATFAFAQRAFETADA